MCLKRTVILRTRKQNPCKFSARGFFILFFLSLSHFYYLTILQFSNGILIGIQERFFCFCSLLHWNLPNLFMELQNTQVSAVVFSRGTFTKLYWNSPHIFQVLAFWGEAGATLIKKEEIKHQSDVFKLEKLLLSLQSWLLYIKKALSKILGLLKRILGEVLGWPLSPCREGQGWADPGYFGLADQRESYEIICIKGAFASRSADIQLTKNK